MKPIFYFFLLLGVGILPSRAQRARSTTQGIHFIKLANTLREVNKSSESIDLLERALPVFRGKYPYWEAVTYELLGLSHKDQRDTAKAVRYLDLARSRYQRLKYVASAWAVNEIIRDISGKNLYAGIQIGASDVKLVILKTDYETDFYEKDIRTVIDIPNVQLPNATLTADASRRLQTGPDALRACFDSIQRYQIPNERTFVVLSTDVRARLAQNPEAKRQLYAQLAEALPNASMRIDTTLTARREAELFTIGAIPRKAWPSTSSLAIGTVSTRGGYFDGTKKKTFHAINLPVGLNTLVNQIENRRTLNGDAFRREAQRVVGAIADSVLTVQLAARRQGLNQRRTVGLGGDIAWALVTYLHPEKADVVAVPITLEDVERFKELALNDYRKLVKPNLTTLADPTLRSRVERDLETIQNQVSEKQLVAGALWLEALMKNYAKASNPKRFVFVRNAEVGWITGKFLETINYEYESTIAKGGIYVR